MSTYRHSKVSVVRYVAYYVHFHCNLGVMSLAYPRRASGSRGRLNPHHTKPLLGKFLRARMELGTCWRWRLRSCVFVFCMLRNVSRSSNISWKVGRSPGSSLQHRNIRAYLEDAECTFIWPFTARLSFFKGNTSYQILFK